MKKKHSGSKTNILLKYQTRKEVWDNKLLNILDLLPFPTSYKTRHLLSPITFPKWMQLIDCVSLNTIYTTPMPFNASLDVLPWNPKDDILSLIIQMILIQSKSMELILQSF